MGDQARLYCELVLEEIVLMGRTESRRWKERQASGGVRETCVFPALPVGGSVTRQFIDFCLSVV